MMVEIKSNRQLVWMIIEGAHWIFVALSLLYAVIVFTRLPNIEPAAILYFMPPLLACLLIIVNTAKGTNAGVVSLCKAFLTAIACSVLLGEQDFLLRNIKPQFPGMPPQQDRILTFYFGAYLLFLGVFIPTYLIGTSIYLHLWKRRAPISFPTCWVGAATWLAAMGVVVFNAPMILNRLF
jgi:hypothetical protein